MRRLSFKKAYVEPILTRRKTSTLRAASSITEGDSVAFTCEWGQPPFAEATVLRVSEVGLAEVDDALARAEGFEAKEELVAALRDLYPEAVHFTRIDFTLESA